MGCPCEPLSGVSNARLARRGETCKAWEGCVGKFLPRATAARSRRADDNGDESAVFATDHHRGFGQL